MSVDVVALLRELKFSIAAGATKNSWLLQAPAGDRFQVHLAEPVERPTAHAVRSARKLQPGGLRPLLAGRTATPGVLEQAGAGGVDILLEEPLQLILRGRIFQSEESEQPALAQPRHRRKAWARRAVERCLLLAEHPLTQSEIADMVGTSQQSVSDACRTSLSRGDSSLRH